MASTRRTAALTHPQRALEAVLLLALVGVALSAPAVRAQSPEGGLIRPSTPLDAAIVQIARFYRQPIGFERVLDDLIFGGTSPIDLSVMTVDEALRAVLVRAARQYRVERGSGVVFVRPADSANDADSWLNQPPGAPGILRVPPRVSLTACTGVPGGPCYTRISSLEFGLYVLPELNNLTLAESWLELQRPGPQRKAFIPRVRPEEDRWRRFDDIARRVSVLEAPSNWRTIAALMTAHGGVAAWSLSHAGPRAVQGQTSLQIDGTAGWTMSFPGIPPAADTMDAMVPTAREDALKHAVTLLPDAPIPPPVGR